MCNPVGGHVGPPAIVHASKPDVWWQDTTSAADLTEWTAQLTDDTNLTPASASIATKPHIAIKSDSEGYWVEWIKNAETGSLGPYCEAEMAESVFLAKKVELSHDD